MSKQIHDKYTLFTQKDCRYCDDAKRLLQSRGIEYVEIEVDMFTKAVFKHLGLTTVPQAFIVTDTGPLHIGGFEELEADVLMAEEMARYAN